MRLNKQQRGDTILEVLIAVAVLSLVLTISFALSNRNTQGNRQAQERGEATKYTETQMELLKTYLAQTTTPSLPSPGSFFCMKKDGSGPVNISLPVSDPTISNFSSFTNAYSNPALSDCIEGDPSGVQFYSFIERHNGADDSQKNTFTAHTKWLKVAGRGIDEASMVHRIYPDLATTQIQGGSQTTGCPVNHYMNSLGGCTICPNGFSSPGGISTSCAPIAPRVEIKVKKILPNSDNTTPDCNGANPRVNKSGIPVTLSIPSIFNATNPTNSTSDAIFGGLSMNTTYNFSFAAPSGYQVCSPSNGTITSGGYGPAPGVGSVTRSTDTHGDVFKVRPVCYSVPDFAWNNYPWFHEVWNWQVVSSWWGHDGPDWGPSGPPKGVNPRYGIGDAKNGYPSQHYANEGGNSVRYDLHHIDNTHGGWYNRFVLKYGWGWVRTHAEWHSNWVYEQVGSHMECPA